jgi:hypothetical protein
MRAAWLRHHGSQPVSLVDDAAVVFEGEALAARVAASHGQALAGSDDGVAVGVGLGRRALGRYRLGRDSVVGTSGSFAEVQLDAVDFGRNARDWRSLVRLLRQEGVKLIRRDRRE